MNIIQVIKNIRPEKKQISTQMSFEGLMDEIMYYGAMNGWKFIRRETWSMIFHRHIEGDRQQVVVYWNKQTKQFLASNKYCHFTVATALNHPKKGKAQLFRKGITIRELGKIFEDPRTHTGKGYYDKKKR